MAPLSKWLYKNGWCPLAIVAACAAVLTFVKNYDDSLEHQAAETPARQVSAETWMQKNEVIGKVTCYTYVSQCDVVPKDSRPPFKIVCGVKACTLP